jgi:uncharacterized damage-inducible protein DinB
MFKTMQDFQKEWTRQAEQTALLLEACTDEALRQSVAQGHRTLGEIAWHLVESLHYMASLGLTFPAPVKAEPMTAKKITEEYRSISREVLQAVTSQWSEASLQETLELWGEAWTRGEILLFTIMHQAHHRGQMTVLMRQAGYADIPRMFG